MVPPALGYLMYRWIPSIEYIFGCNVNMPRHQRNILWTLRIGSLQVGHWLMPPLSMSVPFLILSMQLWQQFAWPHGMSACLWWICSQQTTHSDLERPCQGCLDSSSPTLPTGVKKACPTFKYSGILQKSKEIKGAVKIHTSTSQIYLQSASLISSFIIVVNTS